MSEANVLEVKKEDLGDCQMVSIENIKKLSTPAAIIKKYDSSSASDSDDEVQFVQATRMHRPAPIENKLQLPHMKVKVPVDEPSVDPLEVKRYFACTFVNCKKILQSGEDLMKHLELRHVKKKRKKKKTQEIDTEGIPSSYTCSYCDMSFEKRNSLAAHMNAHKDDESKVQVECKVCGEKFHSAGTLWNHKKMTHTEDLQRCEICNKTFVTRIAHQKHLQKHEEEGVIMCDICGKSKFQTVYPINFN